MFHLTAETPEDEYEVETLYDLSFTPGREALSSYRLRDGVSKIAELSLVARDKYNILAGAIRYWPVAIGPKNHPALLLGPIAVHPTRQGEGLGALLMAESLDLAAQAGWQRVLLVGDAPYYARFGFELNKALQFPAPTNPNRILSLALTKRAFEGVVGQVKTAPQKTRDAAL